MGTLLFLITLLFLFVTFLSMIFYLFKGNRTKVKRLIIMMATLILLYGITLLIVSSLSKPQVLSLHQNKCFDEWCVSIEHIDKTSVNNTIFYTVKLQISNHGKGRTQRPDNPCIYVIDQNNNVYEGKTIGRSLTSAVAPQTSFETSMVFTLPQSIKGFVVITEGGFPTALIIGDEGSFFHAKTQTPLF